MAAFLAEYVITPKGTGAGRPFILRPWQLEIVAGLFDDPRPRQGLVSIPRGNGKSTLAAALALYGLFADGEHSPQVAVVASDERQAGIVRMIAKRMVELSDALAERTHIFKDRLEVPETDGVLMSLPAAAEALHGWDPTLLIVDELHVVTEETWEAVTSAAGKREQSLTLAISTPAASRDSVMWRLVEEARIDPDPAFFFTEFAAPIGCDIDDDDAWHQANPALGDFLHLDGMKALRTSMRESTFRRLRLGQWIEDEGQWIAGDDWQVCADADRVVELGATVVLGFDGSVGDDSTALVAVTVEERPHVFTLGVWAHPEGPQHRDWRVPRDEVDLAVESAFDVFDVVELAADPFGWRTELELWAEKYGRDRVLEYPTNMHKRMAAATERFYSAVRDARITHSTDATLTRHVLAAVVKATPSGDVIQKDRRWSPRKIDAAVAAILALDRAVWHLLNPPVPVKVRTGKASFL